MPYSNEMLNANHQRQRSNADPNQKLNCISEMLDSNQKFNWNVHIQLNV